MRRIVYKIFYNKKSFLQPISFVMIPILLGIFLFINIQPVKAAVIAPVYSVFGVVTDSATSETLSNVTVHINTSMESFSVQTNELGLYQQLFIDCDNYFNSVTINVSHEGYQDYNQVISVPCYSTYQHNIALELKLDVPEPVILIPGIMGSWNANLLNGIPWAEDKWVIDPILHTYDQLIDNLVLYGGYVVDETLFPFPYDWRISNVTTASFLRDKINEVKSLTGANKVDIVTHSMGGLIARYYAESGLYQNDVDQVIFIATPHRGSPKSYLAWEGGYTGVRARTDFFKELLLKQMAIVSDYDSVFDYVRNYPVSTVQELLPDYEYLIDKSTSEFIPYANDSTDYPQNTLLHFLNQPDNIDLFFTRVGKTTIIYNSDSGNTPVSFEIIPPTQEQLPQWEHGYPDGFGRFNRTAGVNLGDGDTTVPSMSLIDLAVDRFIEKVGVGHMSIVSNSSANVLDILQGIYVPINVIDEPNNYIIIQVYSPLDVQIISPTGLKIGSDFIGGELNEISGAYYSGLGAVAEFAVISNPELGQYQILTQGTDAGKFGIDISYANDNGIDTKSVSGATNPGLLIDFSFEANQGISNLLPDDKIPPLITINSPTDKQYLHSEIVGVDYEVTDDGTGVSQQQSYLNDVENSDSQFDLFNFSLGEHQFKVQAYDMVNNQSEQTVTFEVIASFDSLEADINRLFNEGDIKDKKTTKYLLKQVDKLEKWYNKINKSKNKHKNKDEDRGDYGDEDWDEPDHDLMDKWLTKLVDKYLNRLEKKGKISTKANDMLAQQITYIINHLK